MTPARRMLAYAEEHRLPLIIQWYLYCAVSREKDARAVAPELPVTAARRLVSLQKTVHVLKNRSNFQFE